MYITPQEARNLSNLDLNVSISYDKIIDIKKDIPANIIESSKENEGIFVPSSLVNNEPMFFAIDNTDLKIDTVDGNDQLHGTAIAVYQQKLQNQKKVPIFQVLCLESQVNRIFGLISPHIFKFANNYLLSRFYEIYITG